MRKSTLLSASMALTAFLAVAPLAVQPVNAAPHQVASKSDVKTKADDKALLDNFKSHFSNSAVTFAPNFQDYPDYDSLTDSTKNNLIQDNGQLKGFARYFYNGDLGQQDAKALKDMSDDYDVKTTILESDEKTPTDWDTIKNQEGTYYAQIELTAKADSDQKTDILLKFRIKKTQSNLNATPQEKIDAFRNNFSKKTLVLPTAQAKALGDKYIFNPSGNLESGLIDSDNNITGLAGYYYNGDVDQAAAKALKSIANDYPIKVIFQTEASSYEVTPANKDKISAAYKKLGDGSKQSAVFKEIISFTDQDGNIRQDIAPIVLKGQVGTENYDYQSEKRVKAFQTHFSSNPVAMTLDDAKKYASADADKKTGSSNKLIDFLNLSGPLARTTDNQGLLDVYGKVYGLAGQFYQGDANQADAQNMWDIGSRYQVKSFLSYDPQQAPIEITPDNMSTIQAKWDQLAQNGGSAQEILILNNTKDSSAYTPKITLNLKIGDAKDVINVDDRSDSKLIQNFQSHFATEPLQLTNDQAKKFFKDTDFNYSGAIQTTDKHQGLINQAGQVAALAGKLYQNDVNQADAKAFYQVADKYAIKASLKVGDNNPVALDKSDKAATDAWNTLVKTGGDAQEILQVVDQNGQAVKDVQPVTLKVHVAAPAKITNVVPFKGVVTVKVPLAILYNKDGNVVANRMLADQTAWKTDKMVVFSDGRIMYRVATNEYVLAENADFLYVPAAQIIDTTQGVFTISKTYTALRKWDSDGTFTKIPSRILPQGSAWKYDKKAYWYGRNYYRVATNEWVLADDGYNSAN
ncbi:hypothetical protein MOO45_07115 [Bombilactobacillus folatiphilus]|uniref:Surface layer protein A domain-containing protein n=1 Tax=Bombilactobacillus folatiphilus TaxID=2923362 RepID=A0ABY4P8B6_9LACO|nr:hypothetical protein [Bombilactobacillus folatiphilus]UQS81950.1 hypothetical protein MOO45_07115 [Bombilactobacillus folatiphilus]